MGSLRNVYFDGILISAKSVSALEILKMGTKMFDQIKSVQRKSSVPSSSVL